MICSNCQFENPSEARFCQTCGQALSRKCPNCGTQNAPAAKFCMVCGERLAHLPTSPVMGRENEAPLGVKSEIASLSDLRRSAPQALQEKVRLAASQIEGERKPVTILFTDIVGSTGLAEKLDPEEWREIINSAHRRVSQAVHRYEGTIAQLLGDGVLAFFGAPLIHEDDPQRAVRAALEIQQAIAEFAQSLSGYVESFQVRVGMHTGMVIVGAVGDDLHMEYLAIGDSVNLAARLQGEAEPGGILISEATARLVREYFDLREKGEISLKGRAESVRAYEVAGLKPRPGSSRGIKGLESPLVGREVELTALLKTLDNLQAGRGGVVFILGEAGIGKSRLIDEARRLVPYRGGPKAASRPLDWLEGRSLSYGSGLSYWAVNQQILADLGLTEGDPAPKIRVALKRRTEHLLAKRAVLVLPYLEHLFGIHLDGQATELVTGVDSETLRHQTLESIATYFKAVAEHTPTVLLFDDLHWADPSTLAALEKLMTLTDQVPLLLVGLMRVDREHKSWDLKFHAETDYAHRFTEIQLEPLTAELSGRLVDNLLAKADLPVDVRVLLLDRADGNPFYLEEVIRSLIDHGALVEVHGRWQTAREIGVKEIPETLQGVLLARIDRLEESVRRTLQLASVIGRSFLFRLLEAIVEAERELEAHLTRLQRLDLVYEKERYPELEYIFKHSLTQEAAYNSLLLERRREFHKKVAEALESIFAERRDEYLGLLAYHFEQSGDTEKAIPYLLMAGDRARLADAQQEAAQFYEKAIKLLLEKGQDALAAQTYLKLGMVYHIDFRFEQAHLAYEAAFLLQHDPAHAQERVNTGQPKGLSLRGGLRRLSVNSLDPGLVMSGDTAVIVGDLFAGIAEVDPELNLLPRGASSWEVFDGGLRYRIHLRDDMLWTDGSPVTAADYESAWMRNLRLGKEDYPASLLDDVKGARDYRMKKNDDPASVGVRAVDEWTLEVMLENPVAYFPYILALPVTFPQPQAAVERYGDDWWRPEHLVHNGPFRVVDFKPGEQVSCERNPAYPGVLRGNLARVEWLAIGDTQEREALFRAGKLDYAEFVRHQLSSTELLSLETPSPSFFNVPFLVFAPLHPLADVRVRQALVRAIDLNALAQPVHGAAANGGVVPPGMAGHSPGISLPYDLAQAQRLLEAAGYPGGRGFPPLTGSTYFPDDISEGIRLAWREGLGIESEFAKIGTGGGAWSASDQFFCHGWMADYPDPDSFLRQSSFLDFLRSHGWKDPDYEELVKRAAETPDRSSRMAMYRRADRYLVVEQALVMPISYGFKLMAFLNNPWVKDFGYNSLGLTGARFIIVDPQLKPRS